MQRQLFPTHPKQKDAETERGCGRPRVREPIRNQVEIQYACLDELLPPEHRARVVWDYVDGLDVSELYAEAKAVENCAGRPAIDRRILLSLWLYATLDGVGSARALDRLCGDHVAYRWLCGGVSVNYHTLADFRVEHVEFLDNLLTEGVATLMATGLVEMNRVAHDGIRIRASAGKSSFRREKTLEEHLEEAQKQVKKLREELEADPSAGTKREQAARMRAAEEREERIGRAREELEEVKKTKKNGQKEKKNARASTTDPEARVMKMANGGFDPAYNGQLTADTETQVIVGVDVTNCGSDGGQMLPMVEQLKDRYGEAPEETLVDGGFATLKDIEKASEETTVYAPVRSSTDKTRDNHKPKKKDAPAVAAWRERMETEEAKEIYKERASTIECVNAIARNRGLTRFLVRGLRKVKAVLLWHALAHNLMRAVSLRALAAQSAA